MNFELRKCLIHPPLLKKEFKGGFSTALLLYCSIGMRYWLCVVFVFVAATFMVAKIRRLSDLRLHSSRLHASRKIYQHSVNVFLNFLFYRQAQEAHGLQITDTDTVHGILNINFFFFYFFYKGF